MAPPSGYTEATLATFMHSTVGRMATVLGWANPASYAEPINETLLAYGAADVADASDIRKLRAIARREVWRAAVEGLASAYDLTADSSSFKRSQMLTQARTALQMAITATLAYDDDYVITIDRSSQLIDPYVYRTLAIT